RFYRTATVLPPPRNGEALVQVNRGAAPCVFVLRRHAAKRAGPRSKSQRRQGFFQLILVVRLADVAFARFEVVSGVAEAGCVYNAQSRNQALRLAGERPAIG